LVKLRCFVVVVVIAMVAAAVVVIAVVTRCVPQCQGAREGGATYTI